MVTTLQDPAAESELAAVYRLYSGMAAKLDPQTGLGGRLIYAGELDPDGFRLIRAANIAGAASVGATSDIARQRQAVREGVVDFLVTSVDEALRILKNEIRKLRGVAVGIGLPREAAEREMLDRGVVPDLLFPRAGIAEWVDRGVEAASSAPIPTGKRFLALGFPPGLSRHAAEFDALLLALIAEDDVVNRRWFMHAPRYLGPNLRRFRSVLCDADAAATLLETAGQKLEAWSGETS